MKNSSIKSLEILSFGYLGISLCGLGLLVVLTFKAPSSILQKQITGALFMVICLLGIMGGISPSTCSRMFHLKSHRKLTSDKREKASPRISMIEFRGHHPTCEKFSGHILKIGAKIYCAGCTGLVTGAIISLFGSCLYFFLGFPVGGAGVFIFWLGFGAVLCGLLQYHAFDRCTRCGGIIHFFFECYVCFGSLSSACWI